MPSSVTSPHEVLLSHLDFIRNKVQQLCRRHHAPPEIAEEMLGDLKIKLLDNDCEVLRRFRGDAKLTTYLSVVIDRFFLDWVERHWGSWRAPVRRREENAIYQEVETLISRDGFSRDEAVRIAASRRQIESRGELRRLDEMVPSAKPRWRPRVVGLEAVDSQVVPEDPSAEDALCAGESERELDRGLSDALASLTAKDRLLVELRYGQGMSVANIARTLGLAQRKLYTRIGRALRELRRHLEGDGLSSQVVREHLARMERFPDFPQLPTARPAAGQPSRPLAQAQPRTGGTSGAGPRSIEPTLRVTPGRRGR